LTDHQAQVAEIDRDILESQNRCSAGLVTLDGCSGDRKEWKRDPGLDASPGLEELQMKIDGRLELRMLRPDCTQFGGFSGLGTGASSRPRG
jgi:hypothetical protein